MIPSWGLNWVAWAVVVACGAAIGSFLNVVIYRLPRHLSLSYPPSHCMSCGVRLTAPDMVPVLSYLVLRGRCRHCGKRFSPRYALVELGTALLAAATVSQYDLSWWALGVFVCLCALMVVIFVDLDHMIIPDETVALVFLVGLIFDGWLMLHPPAGQPAQLLSFPERYGAQLYTMYLPRSIVGALFGAGVFLFITWVFTGLMGRPVMGMGDVKLAGAMGALLGPGYGFLVFFLLSILLGAVISVGLVALRIRGRRDYIPFGPMMALAGMALLLWGGTVIPFVLRFYQL